MTSARKKPGVQARICRRPNRRIVWLVAGIAVLIAVNAALFAHHYIAKRKTLAEFSGGRVTKDEFVKVFRLEIGKFDPVVWKDAAESQRIKSEILHDIIREKILLAKAGELGMSASDEELESEYASFKAGYTDETFKKMLDLRGINYDEWKERKRGKYIVQKLIEKEVTDKIDIKPSEISKYYGAHAADFQHPEQVRARHILAESWEEAEAILKELQGGENFAAIAKNRSISPERWNGGDLGYFARGIYPEVFDRVCFSTPVGDTSPIVKSEYGYHVFRIIDKRGPEKETLEEAKPRIIRELRLERSADALEKWFAPIYEAAKVRTNEGALKEIEVTTNEAASAAQ